MIREISKRFDAEICLEDLQKLDWVSEFKRMIAIEAAREFKIQPPFRLTVAYFFGGEVESMKFDVR